MDLKGPRPALRDQTFVFHPTKSLRARAMITVLRPRCVRSARLAQRKTIGPDGSFVAAPPAQRWSKRQLLGGWLWLITAALLTQTTGCSESDAGRTSRAPSANIKAHGANTQKTDGARSTTATNAASSGATQSSLNATQRSATKSPQTVDTAVPKGGIDELMAFLHKLDEVRLEENTPAALADFVRVQKAILEGVDKLLVEKALNEDTRIEAIVLKWNATILLLNLDDEGAEERFLKVANELARDKNPIVAKTARVQLRQLDVLHSMRDLVQGSAKNTEKLLQDVDMILKEEGLRYAQFDLVRKAARVLESQEKYDEAAQIYERLEKAFEKSDDPQLVQIALETTKRANIRLGWIGKQADLTGRRLDGQPFDLSELKGKVVLVDFWATWCPPCVAEIPNVKDNYQKYRDRGFEVVGVSQDEDRDALETFVDGKNATKEKLPWITLWTSETVKEGENEENPFAKKFGVDGLPETLLIDQSGKVVSLGLRGERLGAKLAELLGEPDEVAEGGTDKPRLSVPNQ
jgi:thiol-disulfide isomerase/thioredoxin